MPYEPRQINACFFAAGREKGAKKKKRESGCKKMVKHQKGHKESLESRLNSALFEAEEEKRPQTISRIKKDKTAKRTPKRSLAMGRSVKRPGKGYETEYVDTPATNEGARTLQGRTSLSGKAAKEALKAKVQEALKGGIPIEKIAKVLGMHPKKVAKLAGI